MKLIVANWKAYVTDRKTAQGLAQAVAREKLKKDITVVLCPPFLFLPFLVRSAAKFSLGVQNVFWKSDGPYTGEITTEMLKTSGVKYAIVGHSERRNHFLETDETVHRKLEAVLACGIEVIVCVGEKARDDPKSVPTIVAEQVKSALAGVHKSDLAHVTIAYEPIWAIGTGTPDTSDDALSAALYIRKVIADLYDAKTAQKVRVLYGGSVDAYNVAEFVNQEGIDGVLIGKASTDKKGFVEILRKI